VSLLNPVVLMSLLLACGPKGTAPLTQSENIRIEVVNSANHRSVKGARVFVLSEGGKELASSSTNEQGIARLALLSESERPKYVVVEHPAFFLSGMRWQSRLREYYVRATVLTLR
jgi:hypothetical protein